MIFMLLSFQVSSKISKAYVSMFTVVESSGGSWTVRASMILIRQFDNGYWKRNLVSERIMLSLQGIDLENHHLNFECIK